MRKLYQYGYKPLSIAVAQINLIEGLKASVPVDTIAGARLPKAKTWKKIRFKKEFWRETDSSLHYFVDLLNQKYVEFIYKAIKMKQAAKGWIRDRKPDEPIVFVYGLHGPYLSCARAVKKLIPKTKIIAIVPDLPQFYDFNMNRVKAFLKRIDWVLMKKQMECIDGYVLFSRNMAEFLNIEDRNYLVMEGSYNIVENTESQVEEDKEGRSTISVLYTGNVRTGYGIDKLLSAFSAIKDEKYELWIAGSGDCVDLVKAHAAKDSRMKYLGFITDRRILLNLQQEATMLISMLPPENRATKYCFPSKLFEYLSSGNPTIAYRLSGIPQEYYKYIVEIPGGSIQDIVDTIVRVGELPVEKRKEIGKHSKEFIKKEKNNIVQAKRMLSFAQDVP